MTLQTTKLGFQHFTLKFQWAVAGQLVDAQLEAWSIEQLEVNLIKYSKRYMLDSLHLLAQFRQVQSKLKRG
jgi:hypothetical protein